MTIPQPDSTPPDSYGPVNPPGSQTAQSAKPPSTFPEQTALLVDVLRISNAELSQQLQDERAKVDQAIQECKQHLTDKARLQARNAEIEGEQKRLLDHFDEVRKLRAADRARHAIVAFISSLAIGVGGGMISATTGGKQTFWVIVLVTGCLLLFLYSLLVYSDDVRRGLRKYGILGGVWCLLFGSEEAMAASDE